jgi:OmpR-family two-component system manganese-sensing sensor histidine kinase
MMFRRARIRLTALYIALFALVLGVFSVAFYVGFVTILAPAFDIGLELTTEAFAQAAYQTTVERIGLALLVANVVVVVLVGVAAWILAARTLRPIDEAHARQRRFVADASHEMRTPLAAMRSSAEGALAAAESADDLRAALLVVARSAERLTRITNDLLMLARSEEFPNRRPEPIDLSVVVAETVESFAVAHPELPRAQLSLGEDLRVSADPVEIGRIVANLLDNGFRYSGADAKSVRIVTKGAEGEALVEVIDSGPGIPAADLERIFEPFYRVHFDATAPEGNGLGLAIARSLAQRNGGQLIAESPPGASATFRVTLPRIK